MNKSLLREITENEIKTFEEDGVVCLRGMFDADWVERMRGALNIVNHFLSVHSARGNVTDRSRRAVAFRFAGDDATFTVRKAQFRLKPFWDPGLKAGDPFPPDHDLFPQVWPAGLGQN